MVRDVLLLDLDETLMVEEPAAVAAFRATARRAAAICELDPQALALAARARARELWYESPTHPYCKRVGISSWEGLWCRYDTATPDMQQLRAWAPTYRREAWRRALADQNVDDIELAEELGERFMVERRARHQTFPDARRAVRELSDRFTLAVVTNGASCLQREKLAASGLADRFAAVVVSGDVGAAKPDPAPFRHALAVLGVEHAVMVGDSVEKDIMGALGAGLDAVWLNRRGRPRPDRLDVPEVVSLADLADTLTGAAARADCGA